MGYDMSTVRMVEVTEHRRIKELEERIKVYEKVFPLEAERSRMDLSELKNPGYFRLNIGGMGQYYSAMTSLGMAYASSCLPWPDRDGKSEEEYELECANHRSFHAPDEPSIIPSHKIYSTNDGWLVTEDEIDAALSAWDRRWAVKDFADLSERDYDTIHESYWKAWIRFLRRAAEHGGFRTW